MKKNVGTIDKTIRIIVGFGIIITGVAMKSFLGLIGLIPLITGLSGHCLLYYPLGLNTCPQDESRD